MKRTRSNPAINSWGGYTGYSSDLVLNFFFCTVPLQVTVHKLRSKLRYPGTHSPWTCREIWKSAFEYFSKALEKNWEDKPPVPASEVPIWETSMKLKGFNLSWWQQENLLYLCGSRTIYQNMMKELMNVLHLVVCTLTLQGMLKSYDLFRFCSLWLIWVLLLKSVFACLRAAEQVEY